jgi:hypothetical protein
VTVLPGDVLGALAELAIAPPRTVYRRLLFPHGQSASMFWHKNPGSLGVRAVARRVSNGSQPKGRRSSTAE